MKIVRFKHWFQVKNDDGFTIAQFLTENEARIFSGTTSSLPCADLKLGNEPVTPEENDGCATIELYDCNKECKLETDSFGRYPLLGKNGK